MKIFYKIKINNYTYLFFLLCALCGYLKNILIIFSICLIHELGHVFFIRLFKYDVVCIELLPFGGFTTTNQKINSNINKDLIIALGGIFFQLIFVLIIFFFKNDINMITYNLFIKYNLILIIFNLMPIIPLDGNNLVHLLIEKKYSFHLSYYLNFIVSSIFLILFSIINYIFNIDNYFIISFLFYKGVIYLKNFKYINNRFLLERYLYNLDYKKIDNNTSNLKSLRKEVLHFFKENSRYVKENKKVEKFLYNKNNN